MAKLKIITYPAKILKKKTSLVKEITPELKKLIDDMFETMYENNGIGLAANQVGSALSVCVVDIRSGVEKSPVALINPKIVSRSGKEYFQEGCLSFPGITANVKRYKKIVVKALNALSMPLEFEAEGIFARAIQHELDHLEGIVFLDRVSIFKRMKTASAYNEYSKASNLLKQAAINNK